MTRKIIVFAPHPDDETFGCGGVIAKKLKEGNEVLIVVLTDGRYSFFSGLGIKADPTPEEVKAIRKSEVKKAVKILGVREENLLFLDFVDGTLEENEMEAQEKVIEILRGNPSPVEVYFPYEKDCHLDHRVTNRIARAAIRKLGIRPVEYRYTIVRMYARVGPLIDAFLNLFRHSIVRVDVSEFLSLKEAAIREFKSELSIISRMQEEPLTRKMDKFLKKTETFYIDK